MSYMLEAQSTFPQTDRSLVSRFWYSVVHRFRLSTFVCNGIIYATRVSAEW